MEILKLTPYVIFENQYFPNDTVIQISPSDFKNIMFIDNRITFYISGCIFNKLIIENKEIIDFNDIIIDFVGCSINNIDTGNIESDNISIHFDSSIVSGRLVNNKITSVSINNCIINGSIFLLNQNSVNISFTDGNIYPRLWKKLLNNSGKKINDVLKINQSYYIYDSKIINFKTNLGNETKGGIYRAKYQSIEDYKIGYHFQQKKKKLLNLNLNIQYSSKVDTSETKIIDSFFNSLVLSGYSNGSITIENAQINEWYIRDFSSQKEVNFYNISPLKLIENESKLEIHKSNLDKTWFDNIDFSRYKTVSFYRTKFGKSTFTSCNFPNDSISFEKFQTLENINYPERKSDNYYKDQYEIFLQLKILLEGTGNFFESQKLQAISNDSLRKIKQISSWDKAILCINSISNNHGLSIKRPFFLFMGSSIILYILYLLSLGRIFNCNAIDYQLIGYYFSFIDITHRVDFLVGKEEFNSFSLFIDFFSKILLGFFTYQFVAAFRKYGKK